VEPLPERSFPYQITDVMNKIVVLHEEQRPRGDQLEIIDKVLLAEFQRLGIEGDEYQILDLLKATLRDNPTVVKGRWISYDFGLGAVTMELLPSPERLEWMAEKVKVDLVNRIQQRMRELSPDGFEKFVRDVVESGARTSVSWTGKSHDGGVDFEGEKKPELGDELSLPVQILGQAKRWNRKATRKDVAAFIGDVDMKPLPKRGRGQRIGIFICSSGFEEDAKISAPRASVLKLALWDAQHISSVMLVRKVGVGSLRLDIPVWDESFWNDYK